MRRCLALSLALVLLWMLASTADAKTYKIGQTATTSRFKVKVFGIQEPWTPTNQFDTPAAGNHYVAVDVQLKNTSKDQRTFLRSSVIT
jgi:hypothetical protein